jgi:hypothetical protein
VNEDDRKYLEEKLKELDNHISEIKQSINFLVGEKLKERKKAIEQFETIYGIIKENKIISLSEACRECPQLGSKLIIRNNWKIFCYQRNIYELTMPSKGRPLYFILNDEEWISKLIKHWDTIRSKGFSFRDGFPFRTTDEEKIKIMDLLLNKFGEFFTKAEQNLVVPKNIAKRIKK